MNNVEARVGDAFSPAPDFLCLTVKEAAKNWRVAERTVRRWAKAGKIPSWQPAGKRGRLLVPLVAMPPPQTQEVPHHDGVKTCSKEELTFGSESERTVPGDLKWKCATQLVAAAENSLRAKQQRGPLLPK